MNSRGVVSYRNSTSNHNNVPIAWSVLKLYLIEILHQTTTGRIRSARSTKLYLIEILHQTTTRGWPTLWIWRCILSKFYIKPQLSRQKTSRYCVVSYRNSTSNHNCGSQYCWRRQLYLIEILHQTTTMFVVTLSLFQLYLIEILHQTTTLSSYPAPALELYLIEILHQTTTNPTYQKFVTGLYLIEILHQTTTCTRCGLILLSCILSKFYIKPQHQPLAADIPRVVSYRNSTSNHNKQMMRFSASSLYLIEILHQTTTQSTVDRNSAALYLIEILHQTTTPARRLRFSDCCILSKFYIKPQQEIESFGRY